MWAARALDGDRFFEHDWAWGGRFRFERPRGVHGYFSVVALIDARRWRGRGRADGVHGGKKRVWASIWDVGGDDVHDRCFVYGVDNI